MFKPRRWTPPSYICASCRRHLTTDATTTADAATVSFALHTVTAPPNAQQLGFAHKFFTSSPRQFLKSTPKFRTLPPSSVPEVAFLGRSNVGKSSLLNAVFARTARSTELARTSAKPGRTRQLCAFGVGGVAVANRGREGGERNERGEREFERWEGRGPALVVLDMPGYGAGSQREWGQQIVKYLTSRSQLRRTFVLIDAEHQVKPHDIALLSMLREHAVPHQVVLSKVDKILFPRANHRASLALTRLPKLGEVLSETLAKVQQEGTRGTVALGDVLGTSSEISWPKSSGRRLGIDALRWAMLQAAGLESDELGASRRADYAIQPADDTGPEGPVMMPNT